MIEQEKREQKEQRQQQQVEAPGGPSGAMFSESDLERLRADVLGSTSLASPPQGAIVNTAGGVPTAIRPPLCTPRPPSAPSNGNWQQQQQGMQDPGKMIPQSPVQPMATQTQIERELLFLILPFLF